MGEEAGLDELGQEMHARRAELREELGLPEAGEEEGAGRAPIRQRPESRQGARSAH